MPSSSPAPLPPDAEGAAPPELPLPVLPPRAAESHKGTYGTVLIVAGSRRYPGAAILAALGAGRAGAGLVQLALVDEIVPDVLPAVPFATLLRCPATDDGGLSSAAAAPILAAARSADAVVVGPGLGTHPDTGALLAALLVGIDKPLLLDADALNLIAVAISSLARGSTQPSGSSPTLSDQPSAKDWRTFPLDARRLVQHAATILTPHPGEFARLAMARGWTELEARPTSPAERRLAACRLARECGSIVVLKGHGSVVTDGRRVRTEAAGNPGMARGGMGDVLSGAIGALLCRAPAALPDATAAVALAVHAHAVAGDLAARELGQEAMLPEDVARLLGHALERAPGGG